MTEPVFFVDRSLARYTVPEALRASGLHIQVHDDLFQPDTEDARWLDVVGRNGWFVITKDKRIRYRRMERRALLEARVGAFVVTAGNLTATDQAALLVGSVERILEVCHGTRRPFIAHVSRAGVIVHERSS